MNHAQHINVNAWGAFHTAIGSEIIPEARNAQRAVDAGRACGNYRLAYEADLDESARCEHSPVYVRLRNYEPSACHDWADLAAWSEHAADIDVLHVLRESGVDPWQLDSMLSTWGECLDHAHLVRLWSLLAKHRAWWLNEWAARAELGARLGSSCLEREELDAVASILRHRGESLGLIVCDGLAIVVRAGEVTP